MAPIVGNSARARVSRILMPSALDVTLTWAGDVIACRHLESGEVALADLAPIPVPAALDPCFAVARVDRRRAVACVPRGAIASIWRAGGHMDLEHGPTEVALDADDVAELVLGPFRLWVTVGDRVRAPRVSRRWTAAWRATFGAAAMHAIVLALAANDARASAAEDREEASAETLRRMMVQAEQRSALRERVTFDGRGDAESARVDGTHGDGRASGGQGAKGEEGRIGDRSATTRGARRYATLQVDRRADASPTPAYGPNDAAEFGMIGLLGQGIAAPSVTSAFEPPNGRDALSADGALWARSVGEEWGAGGLGLHGIGESCGGCRGFGVGLGSVGSIGHGNGYPGAGTGGDGSRAARHATRVWSYRYGDILMVSSRIPPDAIQRIMRQSYGRFRRCYEAKLLADPSLAGRVSVRFVIGRDGAVSHVSVVQADMAMANVASCVAAAVYGISFPQPEGGIVTVIYPIVFSAT